MNVVSRLVVAWAVRGRNLLRANLFSDPKEVAVVARYEEKVDRAQALMSQQENGVVTARGARRRRTKIKNQMRAEPLKHLVEIARAAAVEKPELTDLFPRLL